MKQRQRKPKPATPRREQERPLPANEHLERELIQCLFVDERCQEAFEKLDERDFASEINRLWFSELKAAWTAKQPFQSVATLKQWFERRGVLQKFERLSVGDWKDSLRVMLSEGGLPSQIGYYCRELRKLRKRRAAALASYKLLELAHDGTIDPSVWIATARDFAAKVEGK